MKIEIVILEGEERYQEWMPPGLETCQADAIEGIPAAQSIFA